MRLGVWWHELMVLMSYIWLLHSARMSTRIEHIVCGVKLIRGSCGRSSATGCV